jgi:hypothetical protein
MAVTAVGDIIVPELFNRYSQERTAQVWELVQSGIVERSAEWDKKAMDGAKTVQMPFFKDLSGASQKTPGNGNDSLDVNKITSSQDACAIHYLSQVWGSNDLAASLAKADPMAAITNLVGDYWAREYQRFLILALTGVFAAASMAEKTLDIHNADVGVDGAAEIDAEVFVDALNLMGDASKTVTAIAMHSYVRNQLWKKDLIDSARDSQSGAEFEIFMGRRVIVDDSMPVANVTGGKKYTTVLFGQGAFAWGEGVPQNPVETDREILKRNSILVNDKITILHPRGVKWALDHAGNSPSDVEIGTGTSWERVFEPKNVRLVAIISNG